MAVIDKVLATVYPLLQTSVEINKRGVVELKRSLEFGAAPIDQYRILGYGRVHEVICDDDLCELLRLISSKDDGLSSSLEILKMRIHGYPKDKILSNAIVSLGQELLLLYQFSRNDNINNHADHELSSIIKACFMGEPAEKNARILCEKIFEAYSNNNIYSMDYNDVMKTLAITQPKVFLDVFLGESVKNNFRINRMIFKKTSLPIIPMAYINDNIIINWCKVNSETRYPIAASVIVPYRKKEGNNILEWTPLALRIIKNYHNPIIILNKFRSAFIPTSWSGSLADIIQSRLCLISDLKNHENYSIKEWAEKEEKILEEEISSNRKWDLQNANKRDERFE